MQQHWKDFEVKLPLACPWNKTPDVKFSGSGGLCEWNLFVKYTIKGEWNLHGKQFQRYRENQNVNTSLWARGQRASDGAGAAAESLLENEFADASPMIISSGSTAAQNNTTWRKKIEGTSVAHPGWRAASRRPERIELCIGCGWKQPFEVSAAQSMDLEQPIRDWKNLCIMAMAT